MNRASIGRHGVEPNTAPQIPRRLLDMELPPFDPLNARAAELRKQGHHVISLGQALPFFPPPASAIDAARAALDGNDVHRYTTDPGLPSLRTALAARLSETTGSPIAMGDLMITAGGNHAFTIAVSTLVDAGAEVVLPAPYFTNHHMVIAALGATPIEAPVTDTTTFAVRWSDIEPHLTSRTRAVVLCTPSNPTGATVDPAEGARIVAELADRGIIVFSDETYLHFCYDAPHWSAASVPEWRRNVVVVGTFSKSFGMMGWRVGYMLADRSVCEQAVKIQDAMIICAPTISQIAADAAVRADWSYAASHLDELRRRRSLLANAIPAIDGLEWTPAQGGLFAFVRVRGCRDSAALARDLLERAFVVTIPGSSFGSSGEGYLRLSFGYAEPADLDEAMHRLRTYFSEGA